MNTQKINILCRLVTVTIKQFGLIGLYFFLIADYAIRFASCDTRHCVNVVIADDVNEPNETIAISLTKITPFLTLTSVDGEILVIDDDGEEENYYRNINTAEYFRMHFSS